MTLLESWGRGTNAFSNPVDNRAVRITGEPIRVEGLMKNADRMIRDRKLVEKNLARLTDGVMLDLCRRAGTRAVRDASGERGPRGKGSYSDPTLAAVIRMDEARVSDPIFDAVRDISRLLDEMARLSMKLDDLARFVQTGKERAKQAVITECKVCGRIVENTPSDRIRSGMCQACYADARRKASKK